MNFYAGIGLGFAICMTLIIIVFGVIDLDSKKSKIAKIKNDEFQAKLMLYWELQIRQNQIKIDIFDKIATTLEKGVSQ